MKHEESRTQSACVQWFDLQYPEYGVQVPKVKYRNGKKYITHKRVSLLFAIPNGGLRALHEARIMSGEGVRPGVSDLFLSVPRGGFHGLYIEMKSSTGNMTPEQKVFKDFIVAQGYCFRLVRSLIEFRAHITAYMNNQIKYEL